MRKGLVRWRVALSELLSLLCVTSLLAAEEASVDGYAEWRSRGCLIVDGQRVCPDARTKFKGEGEATSFEAIPLGYELKAKGPRRPDGAIVPKEIEAKPNGLGMIENTLTQSFNETERKWLRAGRIYEEDDRGRMQTIGTLLESGPRRRPRPAHHATPPSTTDRRVAGPQLRRSATGSGTPWRRPTTRCTSSTGC